MEDLSNFLSFWDKLKDNEKLEINKAAKYIDFKKGTKVHKAEDSCLGILIVKSGLLKVYMLSEEGREIPLFKIADNDICVLSATCVLTQISFDVFIDAQEDTKAIQINAFVFSKIIKSNIYAECFTYKLATERFSDVMWSMQQLLFLENDKRLANFLIDEFYRTKSNELLLTHEEIAKNIGSVREVVTRLLKIFEEKNIIKSQRGKIKILDIEKLKNYN